QLAFVTLENDPAWRQRKRPIGSYISAVRIPGNFLNDGLHYVNCHLLSRYPDRIQFSMSSIVAFQVVDSAGHNTARGDYTGPLEGVVRPLLEWKTQKIAKLKNEN
ncbi:MAG: ABC transporter ATP-binding protein, partial [Planctomycetota bacterium]